MGFFNQNFMRNLAFIETRTLVNIEGVKNKSKSRQLGRVVKASDSKSDRATCTGSNPVVVVRLFNLLILG